MEKLVAKVAALVTLTLAFLMYFSNEVVKAIFWVLVSIFNMNWSNDIRNNGE